MTRRLLGLLVLLPFALRAQSSVQRQGEHEDPAAREAWYWNQRTYPNTQRPYAAVRQMRLSLAQTRARFSILPSTVAAATGLFANSWRPLGPYGLFGADNGYFGSGPQLDAGRVTGVVSDGKGTVVIGTASGGVWRSTTLGATWTPTTDGQCSLNVGAIAMDPVNSNVIYAGTGEYNQNSIGCGVLRSTDGGVTWTLLTSSAFLVNGGYQSAAFAHILVDKNTAGTPSSTTLLGATNVALYRSTNGGATWSLVVNGAVSSVVQHPTKPGVFFAADVDNFTATNRGVYKSTNSGATWTALPALPGASLASMGRIELAASPAAPDRVYALVANRSTSKLAGLWVWDDAAQIWTQLNASGIYTGDPRADFGAQAWYDLAMQVDPRDANRVYVSGVRAYRSTDGGQTFTPMAMEIHCDWHALTIDPGNPDVLYAGTDGGVFVSTDAGATWTSKNAGLVITQYYPGISIHPSGTVITGGSQDNGTHQFSGSVYWDGFNSGDGGYTAINYNDPTIVWSESQWDASSGAQIDRESSTSFVLRAAGISSSDRAEFIPPFIMDPVTPTTLYFGTNHLYRTTNEGVLWTAVGGGADLTKGSGDITRIAVSPANTGVIYVGTSDGNVEVSTDSGATFAPEIAGLPNRDVTDIFVDRANANHAILTVSGFGSGHVFETANAGASWTDISGSLADVPTNAVTLVGTTIMIGTDVGVFQSADDGRTWVNGPSGLPNAEVTDLVYQPASNLLVAGTYGRGMWQYTVGGEAVVLRGDANGDGKIDAFDALLIQQALVSGAAATSVVYPRGDANCNGRLDAADLVLVLRQAVGLPNGTSCVGTTK